MLIEKARELGVLIAASPEFLRYSSAKQAVFENESLSGLLEEFTQKRDKLVSCLSDEDANSMEAVALTDDIDRLRAQLSESPLFSELMVSQEAFSVLLGSVNAEINACIGLGGGCTHDCTSCSGCAH